jgi:hypothetical protein
VSAMGVSSVRTSIISSTNLLTSPVGKCSRPTDSSPPLGLCVNICENGKGMNSIMSSIYRQATGSPRHSGLETISLELGI